MTNRPPLNPPETPMCEEYMNINIKWAYVYAVGDKQTRMLTNKFETELKEHRASCPLCQARMTEITELAKNAREPEADR